MDWWQDVRTFVAMSREGFPVSTPSVWTALMLALVLRRRWRYNTVQPPHYIKRPDGSYEARPTPPLYEFVGNTP
jgi:hypothetical protein